MKKARFKISKKSIILAAILVILIGIPAIAFLWIRSQEDGRVWYSSSWMYRKAITVSGNGSSTLTNEDVLVTLDTATLVSQSKLQSDCDDLRLVDSDDSTLLSYWIEDDCNTSSTKVWVRIPSLPSGGKTIYVYYGNPSATKGSLTWSGYVTLLADASCPSGWTRNSAMDGRFIQGNSTYGGPGGAADHTHGNMSCEVDDMNTIGATTSGPSSGGSYGVGSTHYHNNVTVSPVDAIDLYPPYLNMIMCYNNKFTIPTNLISLFDATVPTGWTRFSALDSKLPTGSATYGGTSTVSTHNHDIMPGSTSSSNGNGSLATTAYTESDGADGAITVSATTDLNTTNLISGRSCSQGGDAVNYSVTALTSSSATVSDSVASGCLVAGDDVLLINLQGTSSYFTNVGNYEILEVLSVSGTTVNFKTNKTKYYGNGASDDTNLGTATSNQRVMLQRVPNYTNVTLNATVHPSAWNGVKGGVIAFESSGTISFGASGKISADARGYRGGTGGTTVDTTGFGYGGESYCGTNGAGRGGGYEVGYNGTAGVCGGGGGGGSINANYGVGGAGVARGGAGGGAGQGGGNPARGGSGAGAGYGTFGYTGERAGVNGGTNTSGAGGAGTSSSDAGGGGGGGTYGVANLSKLYFGSGGGGGGGTWAGSAGGNGGVGGGIVLVHGNTITTSGLGISSVGYSGTNGAGSGLYFSGGGGAGSGGSVKIVGNTVSMGTSIVNASGGAAGGGTRPGAAAGAGRIAVEYRTSVSGTASPASTNTQITTNLYAANGHTHTSTGLAQTSTDSHMPPYIDMIYGKNNASKYVTSDNILIADVLPPLGWNRVSALDSRFPRGSSSYGGTGGSSTHTHTYIITTSGPSTTIRGVGTGGTFAGSSHYHSCSVSTDPGSNIPPYINVLFIQRKDSLSTALGSEEVYNQAPSAPTSLLTEGLTNPTQVTDLTPEFSAIYLDPDDSDIAVYYEVEVNTNNLFTGTVMWDSGKTAMTSTQEGNQSPDISYNGSTLSTNGITYYWRIRFWDDDDAQGAWSSVAQFTMNYAPNAPSALQTEGQEDPLWITDLTPEFTAVFSDSNSSDTGTHYEIEVNTNEFFSGTVMWDTGQTAISSITNGTRSPEISYAGTALSLSGTTYYWRIRFWDNLGSVSPWSANGQFTMNQAPDAPSALQTESTTGPIKVVDLTPEFSAYYSDSNGNSMSYYQIEVNTSSIFTGTVMWDSGQTASTPVTSGTRTPDISYAGTPLSLNTAGYYWRMRVWDEQGTISNWSATASFIMSGPPNAPTGLMVDGSPTPTLRIASQRPEFRAEYIDLNNDDAIYYEIEVNTNSSFTGTVMWDTGKQSISPVQGGLWCPPITYNGAQLLGNGTTYYWRIRFWDTDDYVSPWSATASFTDFIQYLHMEGIKLEGLQIN